MIKLSQGDSMRIKKKPDWVKIRAEYETTKTSYRKIAAKYGVSFDTLQVRARKEKWRQCKDEYTTDTTKRIRQKLAEKKSSYIVDELDPALQATELMNNLILKTLQDEKQFNRHLIQMKEKSFSDGSGEEKQWVEEQEFDVVDTKRLQAAAQALKISKELQRLLKGIMTAGEKEKLAIERERLKIEQDRMQREKASGDEVFSIKDPFEIQQNNSFDE